MNLRSLALLVTSSLVVLGLLALPTAASTPSEGTLNHDGGSVTWGGEFQTANILGCTLASVPTHCDSFELTVDAHDGDPVRVTLDAPDAQGIQLYVFSSAGEQIAAASGTTAAALVFVHRAGYGAPYEVRAGQRYGPDATTYTGIAELGGRAVDAGAPDCLQATPHRIEPPVVGDHDTPVEVTVHVLVDRNEKVFFVDHAKIEGWTRNAFEATRGAYAPLAIDIADVSYEHVDFEGTVTTSLIQQAKDHLGGGRTPGIDVVFVATNKDLTGSDGSSSVAGQADCIGGVAAASTAVAVGEIRGALPGLLSDSFDSIVVAHEIGHLFGAHHHLGNCVQGEVDPEEENYWPCTVMLTGGAGMSMRFGSVNGSVVRGHATFYAKP